jgi:dynein heavy chain
MEKDGQKLVEDAKMFEVTVPDYKGLRQCRKEIRLLKQLWDYIIVVEESFKDWNSTPWKEINVEVICRWLKVDCSMQRT